MERQILDGNMKDFDSFVGQLPKRNPRFTVKFDGEDVYMSLLNNTGSHVTQFLWFRNVESSTDLKRKLTL
jgi:hypothetical protein